MAPRLSLLAVGCGLIALLLGEANAKVCPRYPLQRLMDEPKLYYQRELFLLAMHDITTTPNIDDIYSHYQMGGIHGLPFLTYNKAETGARPWVSLNGTWYGGLCWHFTNPWMHWHRFYMLTYEKGIRLAAVRNAKTILKDKSLTVQERRQWRKAAKELRLPRWDWFDPAIATDGLPSILLTENMVVTNPEDPTGPKIALHNPLHSYKMQASPVLTAPPNEYGQRLRNNYPFNISEGQYTYRYGQFDASGQLTSNSALFNKVFETFSPDLDIQIRLSLQPDNWDCFALGPADRANGVVCNDWRPSFNDVHSNIHVLTGGIGLSGYTGTMLQAESTGLDPIFFMHHSNIDFIFALYQAFKPDVALTDGQFMDGTFLVPPSMDDNYVGSFSDMSPFYKNPSRRKSYYKAKDANNYYKHDYTYIEIQEAAEAAGIHSSRFPTTAKPDKVAAFQKSLDEQLFAKYNLKKDFAGYHQAAAFLVNDESFDGAEWTISVTYTGDGTQNISCGSMSVTFGGLGNSMGGGFIERRPTVQLTQCLVEAGILTNTVPGPKTSTNPGAGPACRVVPAVMDTSTTAPFTVSITLTVTDADGGVSYPELTQAEVDAVVVTSPTFWTFEETFINVPSGLNAGLPACAAP